MKLKHEIEQIEQLFKEGNGFGDPDARRDAELKLQTLISKQQLRTAYQLNIISWIMAIATVFNVILIAIQIFKNCP
ncbi:MAG: hypothetical protein HOP11_12695 [Saprospiraceae bacterium]|nr:hypothetical protein [Saprospiraceae bacterium]